MRESKLGAAIGIGQVDPDLGAEVRGHEVTHVLFLAAFANAAVGNGSMIGPRIALPSESKEGKPQ